MVCVEQVGSEDMTSKNKMARGARARHILHPWHPQYINVAIEMTLAMIPRIRPAFSATVQASNPDFWPESAAGVLVTVVTELSLPVSVLSGVDAVVVVVVMPVSAPPSGGDMLGMHEPATQE